MPVGMLVLGLSLMLGSLYGQLFGIVDAHMRLWDKVPHYDRTPGIGCSLSLL